MGVEKELAALNEKHNRGEITYDELTDKGSKILDKAQAACPHKNTSYDKGTGKTWCNNPACGAAV